MMDQKRKFWSDILIAINSISDYIRDIRDFDVYVRSPMVKDAVERQLIILGEAINKLERLDPDHMIEDAHRIRAVRNRLVHAYDKTDDAVIWLIIQEHLEHLREQAQVRSLP